MKPGISLLLLLTGLTPLLNAEQLQSGQDANYSKIFAEKNWDRSDAFMNWAKPLSIDNSARKACSEQTRKRLSDSVDRVLFCQQVATVISEDQSKHAELVWAILKRTVPAPYGHDCNAGLVYLDKKQRVIEDSPADCKYALEVNDPSDTPIMVFQVIQTGEIGVVFDGHGAECGGRAVMKQEGDAFKRIHEFYWNCFH